jgi:hypothetical protein
MSKRNSLSPTIWGPKTWFYLESMAIGYPEEPNTEEKTAAKNQLLALQYLLPCGGCRYNYTEYITEYMKNKNIDDVVKDRYSLINFIIDVHNDVRVRNGQAPRVIGDVFTYYQNAYLENKSFEGKESFDSEFFDNKSQEKLIENIKNVLYHFNPLTLLIGIMLGLIIYKYYNDSQVK